MCSTPPAIARSQASITESPPPAAIRFLKSYQTSELRVLSQNRSLSAVVRQEARRLLAQRH